MVMKKTKDVKIYGGKRYLLMSIHSTKNNAKKEQVRLRNRKGTKFYSRISLIPKSMRDWRGKWALWTRRKTKGK